MRLFAIAFAAAGLSLLTSCATDEVTRPMKSSFGTAASRSATATGSKITATGSEPTTTAQVTAPATIAPTPRESHAPSEAAVILPTFTESIKVPISTISPIEKAADEKVAAIPPQSAKTETVSIPVAETPAKETVVVATLSPIEPAPDSANGTGLAIGLCLGLVAVVLFKIYRQSTAGKMHRRMKEIIDSVESTLSGQKELSAKAGATIKESVAAYAAEVRRGYLMAVSIDEVRKVAPGVRLKPLHDRGLNNLLACQGWDAARFLQLRGIGPESAGQIAVACAALTRSVMSQSVAHPRVKDPSPGAQKSYRAIYDFGQIQEKFAGQDTLLNDIGKDLRPQCEAVGNQTTFWNWLVGSSKKGPLNEALKSGATIEAKIAPKAEMGLALTDAQARLTSAAAMIRQVIPSQTLADDVTMNGDLYREFFEKLLGTKAPDARGSKEWSGDRLARDAFKPKRETPVAAQEPVRVRASAEASSRFSIEIRSDGELGHPVISAGSISHASECWVPPGEQKMVGALVVRDGMIYVGRNVPSVNGQTVEPALINPTLPISTHEADCHTRMLNYWSSYSFASPAARASYLQWLSTGRNDPKADIGYVFLYFYGLERRALADATKDQAARAEIPAIVEEVRRLRSIYGDNGSFNRYSSEFLDHVEAAHSLGTGSSNTDEPPPLTRYHLTFGLRRKLGQLAESGQPLPANWAYTWYHNDPRTRLLAAAERCPAQMAALFAQLYQQQFGAGFVLPANKTRLKITYRPASASFGGSFVQAANLPDVSILTASYGKLDAIATECFQQLDGYSRYIGRNLGGSDKFEGIVLLPGSLWPSQWKAVLENLAKKVQAGGGAHPMKFQELLELFGEKEEPGRSVYLALCRSLASSGIGLEPDVRFGGEVPSADDVIALFQTEAGEVMAKGYGLAALMLRLASALAASDGELSEAEAQVLHNEIQNNATLYDSERQRLRARLARYRIQAPPITGLKPTIQQLSMEDRSKITDFLLAMVYSDRMIAPGEVKMMEKIYTLFGMKPSALYTRLHELSSGTTAAPATTGKKTGPIHLNAEKVKQLRAASDAVTQRLAVIFDAENAAVLAAEKKEKEDQSPATMPEETLLSLDVPHAELLGLLTGRTQWTRAEFEELCADKGLMPDGAIERINDAAFTKYDQAIIEGEDPLEIAVQLLEETLYAPNHSSPRP